MGPSLELAVPSELEYQIGTVQVDHEMIQHVSADEYELCPGLGAGGL